MRWGVTAGTIVVILLAILSACSSSPRPTSDGQAGYAAVPPEQIEARFVPGGQSDVIVLSVKDWRALRSAVLISPDGERVPAYSLDVEPSPVGPGPLGAGLLSPALGVPQSVERSDRMVSTALLRPPDPVVYSKTWQGWRIEVAIGDGDNRHEMTLPAPKSPPV